MILPQALGWLAIDIHRRWRSSMLMLDTTAVMARRVVTLQKLSKFDTWSTCLQKISPTWSEEMMNNCGCNSNCSLWTNPATECASKSRQRSAMPASSFINTWGSREDCARSIGEKNAYDCIVFIRQHTENGSLKCVPFGVLWGKADMYILFKASKHSRYNAGVSKPTVPFSLLCMNCFFRRAQSNLCDRYQFVFDGYCVKICWFQGISIFLFLHLFK